MTKAPSLVVNALRAVERLSFEAPPNSLTPRIAAVARAALSTAEREAEVKAKLVEALENAARRFREYEDIHAKKQTIEGDMKARANAREAEACEAALKEAATGGAE